ncbi:MAG TPA: hypothetical protein VN845_08145 [Solirubrobacteraceae bacterium]|nr:hypothetical protein [Solirubrobacteraceae bacterium]
MHRTYRWLDAPPRLLGFTFSQWAMLILAVGAGYGCVKLLHVPAKIAISTGVFLIGLPAMLAYLSEGDGLGLGRLIADAVVWMCSVRVFDAAVDSSLPRVRGVRVEPRMDGDVSVVEHEPATEMLEELFREGRWGE